MYKFNNGKGAIICDKCSVIIKEPAHINNSKETIHHCVKCTAMPSFIKEMLGYEDNDGSS